MVRKPMGELTKDYREILNMQYVFFKDLYTKDTNVQFTMVNTSGTHLQPDSKLLTEAVITKDELYDSVMTLKWVKHQALMGLPHNFTESFGKTLLILCLKQ